ncbi:hypothetical protein F4818DRAFT_193167 [Hypoxylon cercidicola]|nr:hypothetical protein F4818DRAFT_193167 [Hypoxylon cercidicola]
MVRIVLNSGEDPLCGDTPRTVDDTPMPTAKAHIYTCLISTSVHARISSLRRALWAASVLCCLSFLIPVQGAATLHQESPLEASSALAACILLLAILSGHIPGWVGPFVGTLAHMLGCNAIDWILCYAALTARTFASLAPRIPPVSRWAWIQLACHLLFALIWAVCLPLLTVIAVYGLLFPFSETSFGNNYNLSFLDPASRRALHSSEPVTLDALGLSKQEKHVPRHALIPYLPLSLYVPNAGFLWAVPYGAENETNYSTDVFFADPFGTRYPWALEEPETPWELDEEQLEFVQSHVWPSALVHLRSRIDRRYVGTAGGDRVSNSDKDLIDEDGHDDEFKRFAVRIHTKPSAPTVWVLEYNPHIDTGFRLYNPYKDCYFATTFRSYGSTVSGNTVHANLQKAYEASCTRSVSTAASTIWVIEGNLDHARTPDTTSNVLNAWNSLDEKFWRGISIINAHVTLFLWQRRYGQMLEMSPSPMSLSRVDGIWGHWSESLIFGAFLGTHLLYILVNQRMRRRGRVDSSSVSFAALLCWSHVLAYGVFGYARPYGAELALVFALRGLREIAI